MWELHGFVEASLVLNAGLAFIFDQWWLILTKERTVVNTRPNEAQEGRVGRWDSPRLSNPANTTTTNNNTTLRTGSIVNGSISWWLGGAFEILSFIIVRLVKLWRPTSHNDLTWQWQIYYWCKLMWSLGKIVQRFLCMHVYVCCWLARWHGSSKLRFKSRLLLD